MCNTQCNVVVKALAVADALAAMGISIDRDAERAIAKTLMTTEHGELRSQCRSVEVIWVIYLGQLPGEDERMWFEERRHGSSMRMVEDADPVVDLRTNEAYCKQHKNSSMTTLERALLDKTGMKWQRYQQLVQERLNENGFSAAASRFNTGRARRTTS